jgi:putative endonuclease
MKEHLRKEVGDSGERIALDYVLRKGLSLVLRNYRCKGGELDLVMLDEKTLVLVEVRVRTDSAFGGAAASVTPAKQKRLIVAAKHLLLTHKELTHFRARFDVVALDADLHDVRNIEWIKDAFRT